MAVQNNPRLFFLFYFLIILQLTCLRISSGLSPTSSPVPSPSPDSTPASSPSSNAPTPSPSSGLRSTLGPASGPSPSLPPTSAPTPSLGPSPSSGRAPGPSPLSGLASGPTPSLGPAPSSGPALGPSPSLGSAPSSEPALGPAPSSGSASEPSPSSGPAAKQASGPSPSLRSASAPAPSISDGPAESEGLYELDSSPTLAPSVDVDPKVKEVCDSTDHPALCLAAVAPLLEGKNDISSVLNAAIRAGLKVARYGLFLAEKLAGDPENSPELASVLNDCTTSYSYAVDDYENAIDAFPEHDIGTMNSMLSGVITNVGDCDDALPNKDYPLSSVSVKLRNMTSNCLAIVSLLD